MNELRDMTSRVNSLEGIKEKYRQGIIETYMYLYEHRKEIADSKSFDFVDKLRLKYSALQYDKCMDNYLGSNERWGIVDKKIFLD